MTRRLLGVILFVGTLPGCAEDEAAELQGAQLLLPDDVDLHWDSSFNREGDGLGALIPVDVMVYEGIDGEPLEGIEVQLEASDRATWLLVDEEFVVVEPELCADCPFLWDAHRDQYLALRLPELDLLVSEGVGEGEGGEVLGWVGQGAPLDDLHEISLETDLDGLARVYLYVDAFPWDDVEADFAPVSVLVSLGTTEESFELVPR